MQADPTSLLKESNYNSIFKLQKCGLIIKDT